MSRLHLPTGRTRAATAAGVAVLVGVGALAATNGEAIFQKISGEHGNESLQEFVKDHPRLNVHSGAIAFAREKLEQQGGEGSGEMLSGPAQEQYDPTRSSGESICFRLLFLRATNLYRRSFKAASEVDRAYS